MSGEFGSPAPVRWAKSWPDALAFSAGLALAWFNGWQAGDLVWSLWLSSLLVGYAMIVWMIFSPALFIATMAWRDRAMLANQPAGPVAAGGAVLLLGSLFLLAFFTFHFGMFHFVHSAFLSMFFSVGPGKLHGPDLALYGRVFTAYWPFVLAAAVAERQAFRWPTPATPVSVLDTAVTPEAIAARKVRNAMQGGMGGMMTPYKNVIRLHLLIFFFAFAHFAKLESFLVYAVVYAAYFFPWRLAFPGKTAPAAA
ncbi:MAG: hypothetical protein EXS41_00245 [Opitutaceae bacterium]|nr:hypothetical protein [Opitutaceae bacterium]